MTPEEKFTSRCAATIERLDLSYRMILARLAVLSVPPEYRRALAAPPAADEVDGRLGGRHQRLKDITERKGYKPQ
jgi:hypothetical protein